MAAEKFRQGPELNEAVFGVQQSPADAAVAAGGGEGAENVAAGKGVDKQNVVGIVVNLMTSRTWSGALTSRTWSGSL